MTQSNRFTIPAAEIPDGKHFFQQHGGKEPWTPSDRPDLLQRLASDHPPAFRTILAGTQFDAEGKPTHLIGPLYFDFDGDLLETCDGFKVFLRKLQEHDVDLDQVRLYASGGRGFHCEVPQGVFMPRPGAVENLHRIYKEMAFNLFANTLDIRVFSVKRQWRVPHVKRDNGQYKVPLSVAEALAITPENYAELCSAPRPFPPLKAPTLAGGLAALYVKARDKAFTAHAKAKVSRIADDEFKTMTGGTMPPTLSEFMAGRIPARDDAGWNQIALNLACVAHALDIDENQIVERARGLIERHQGDGKRYATPRARERELRDQYRYTRNNGAYSASVAALLKILPTDAAATDLRDLVAPVPDNGFPTIDLLTGHGKRRRLRTDVEALLQLLVRDDRLKNLVFYDQHQVCLSATRPFSKAMDMAQAPGEIDELNDDHALALMHWFAREWKLDIGKDKAFAVLRSWCLMTPRNPVHERLNDLAQRWDGEARLDSWLIDHLHVSTISEQDGRDITPLIRAFGTKSLISVVARALDPGCQVDTMLVLIGGQGSRKSTALRVIGEAIDPRAYADSFDINDHSKDRLQKLRGKCLVEWAEMAGLSKRDVREIKTFLTERNDEFRAPYERTVRKWPRTAVFAGSSNNDELLADETGGRRFWIVRTGSVISDATIQRLRQEIPQVLGEAVHRYRAGEKWWIDPQTEPQLEAMARNEQESVAVFSQFDALAIRLAEGALDFNRALGIDPTDWNRSTDIENALVRLRGESFSPPEWKVMCQALLRQGWERAKKGKVGFIHYRVTERLRNLIPVKM